VSFTENHSGRVLSPEIACVGENETRVPLAIQQSELCGAFGVDDPIVAARMLSQLLGVLHPDSSKPIEPALVEEAVALVKLIGPTDATEAMLAVMMVAAECSAMDSMRRASHPAQSAGGRQSYTSLSLKAMRTSAQLLEALNHGRGKSVTQRVIVERVTVEAGGHAIVGAVAGKGGGG